jgi:hypothetical protein
MKRPVLTLVFTIAFTFSFAFCAPLSTAQETAASDVTSNNSSTVSIVPRLVRFAGTARDLEGKALSGTLGLTFLLYSEETGGSPLWLESQNVQADLTGHYSVQLGASKPDGLPTELFASGEARWLGIQIAGQTEQPRVLLLSVPYALKAGDAETVGGLPASAFVLAGSNQPLAGTSNKVFAPTTNGSTKKTVPPANPAVSGKGTADYIPMWDTTSDIIDSIMFQKSSEIGINTTTPAATLDVNGKADVRDTLTLYPKSSDSTLAVNGTSFKVDSTGKVTFISGQTFPGAGTITGITTASGSGLSGGGTTGTLSLKVPSAGITNAMLASSKVTLNSSTAGGLTTPGAMTLGDTYTIGLKTCSANQVLQYNGTAWACASTGTGTITGVTAGTGLSGGGTSGSVTLANSGVLGLTAGTGITVGSGQTPTIAVNTAVVPELNKANTFTGNQGVTGNLSSTGELAAGGAPSGNVGSGTVEVDAAHVNNGAYGPGLLFGGGGEGIASNRNSGVNQYGLNFFTSYLARMAITNAGLVGIGTQNPTAQLEVDTSVQFPVFASSSYTSATGITGFASSASGDAWGVQGETFSSDALAYGVYGLASAGSGDPIGVYGQSQAQQGIGVFGQDGTESSVGATAAGYFFFGQGAWGDGGSSGIGVLGTSDNGSAGFFVTTGATGAGLASQSMNSEQLSFESGYGSTFGFLTSYCDIDSGGNLNCTGSKNAVVPVDGGMRTVALSAIESPTNWFEDVGSGQLTAGAAVVALDSTFMQTANTEKQYQVFVTPYGDCKGLYVSNRTAGSFEVHELGGGNASVNFGYRIMALRRNYENVRFADHTHDQDGMKRMREMAQGRQLQPHSHNPKKKTVVTAGKQSPPSSLGRLSEENRRNSAPQ